jgi:hypothetical protein
MGMGFLGGVRKCVFYDRMIRSKHKTRRLLIFAMYSWYHFVLPLSLKIGSSLAMGLGGCGEDPMVPIDSGCKRLPTYRRFRLLVGLTASPTRQSSGRMEPRF